MLNCFDRLPRLTGVLFYMYQISITQRWASTQALPCSLPARKNIINEDVPQSVLKYRADHSGLLRAMVRTRISDRPLWS